MIGKTDRKGQTENKEKQKSDNVLEKIRRTKF